LRFARQVTRRLTWGVGDQAMSSLTNFLLTIFIARTLHQVQFGAFTLAYVTYGFADNASRGLSIEPLLVRFSGTARPIWRRATASCTGTALLVGVVTGAGAIGAGFLIGGTTGLAFFALGLTLPGLLLQDSWRYSFFAIGRGYHAFINDTIWAVLLLPALVALKATGHANVFWFVLAWGTTATVAAVIAPLQARVTPNLARAPEWLSRHRDLGPRYFAENVGGNAADTLRSYSLSYILGLAAVGYIQAANTLMGPFKIVFFGLSLITLPEAAKLLRSSPQRLPLFCAAVGTGLAVLAAIWGVVLLIALPHGLGHLMLGSLWQGTYPLVLPATLAVVAGCVTTGAVLGLHALGTARRSMRAVIVTAALSLASSLAVALAGGGTVWTMRVVAAALFVGAILTWWQFRVGLREAGIPPPRWMFARSPGNHRGSAATGSRRRADEDAASRS
jgi:O-antigen/teichoic acid export membrane protein